MASSAWLLLPVASFTLFHYQFRCDCPGLLQLLRVQAKVDTVGEFKLHPMLALEGMGMEPILRMPKFSFSLWAYGATSQKVDGG